MYKTVALACDHAGFSLKNELMLHLSSRGIEFRDFGTYNEESCDYPDYAAAACRAVLSGECDCAILVCGTGVGMSIAANKFDGIRAACCNKKARDRLKERIDMGVEPIVSQIKGRDGAQAHHLACQHPEQPCHQQNQQRHSQYPQGM